MNKDALFGFLNRYTLKTQEDYNNALKEIIQEITLLGLWRAKFFEHAAFYGGTALRILYGLNRFSEDLDFTLYKKQSSFHLEAYQESIIEELRAYGFAVEIREKKKNKESKIHSAFLRANTREHVLMIGAPHAITKNYQTEELIKIKMEIDTEPVTVFSWESRDLFLPIPFSVRVLTESSLFAGKLHAVLCRKWGLRVKGRDWYDFIWFIGRGTPVDLEYLEEKMRQSGHYKERESMTLTKLKELLRKRIEELSIEKAKEDITDFLPSQELIAGWSKEVFLSASERIKA